ncbi:NAD(P)/FAD-dependent oxidoreductase [Anoxybacterium hadale]|uniref:NAD(P)/FAD-dependent oxidoreductase n=1 Tax=Anoxybacterium hadale TaxID=3408580 RepID=A0ACD1A7J2_9FIRM|nr:NAD(P)/FAD-dependent oxidoreductase [Clostridiales bacterium]
MKQNITGRKNITVIGGGPSGMMAAVTAARREGNAVRLLEKNEILGRKLLATGNGRCNLTNLNCKDAADTLEFFSEIGLLTRSEGEGRVYPYSEQASAVCDVLIHALRDLHVEVICKEVIQVVETQKTGFVITTEKNKFDTDAVILATGGKAGPQYGSTGDGFRIAKHFGHTIVRTMPSLVQLVSEKACFRLLKGVRTKSQAELLRDGSVIAMENGEIQFTEDGLSGICIFNLSKYYQKGDAVRLDLFPEYDLASLLRMLEKRVSSLASKPMAEFFLGMVHKKLTPVLLGELSLDETRKIHTMTIEERSKIAELLKGWVIPISGTKGWKEAQVTSGGIDLSEVDLNTMESKLVPKLYFAGELLDWDGICGGYNLQWAWSSGKAAGRAAAEALGDM